VNSITSVTYLSGSAEDSSTYGIGDSKVGELYRISGTWAGLDWHYGDTSQTVFTGQGRKVWTIVYSGGWYTPRQDDEDGAVTRDLPHDVEHAVIAITTALYRSEGRDPTLKSESLMEARQTYGGGTTSQGVAQHWIKSAVPVAAAILDRYKRGYLG
jgi:hypothetical protein